MSVKVLIVEDETLIAYGLVTDLKGTEFDVVGEANTVAQALQRIESTTIDLVLLDGNLRGESAEPVAARLKDAGIPFIILTGYSSEQFGDWKVDGPRLNKPYAVDELLSLMRDLV